MLTFYPELDFNEKTDNVIIVAIDCSNSMKGETFVNAVKVRFDSNIILSGKVKVFFDVLYNVGVFADCKDVSLTPSRLNSLQRRCFRNEFLRTLLRTSTNER